MAVYPPNTTEPVYATFSKAGVAWTPNQVTITVTDPTMVVTVKHKGDSGVYNHANGVFYFDLAMTLVGDYVVDWVGTGTFVDTAGDTRPYSQASQQILRCRT